MWSRLTNPTNFSVGVVGPESLFQYDNDFSNTRHFLETENSMPKIPTILSGIPLSYKNYYFILVYK